MMSASLPPNISSNGKPLLAKLVGGIRYIGARCYDYLIFYSSLCAFAIVALLWSLIAPALAAILPAPLARQLGRGVIHNVFRAFLYCLGLTGRLRFELEALDVLKSTSSLIIAPNHPTLWDAVLIVSRLPDVACVMKAELIGNLFIGGGARLAHYIRNESPRRMILSAVNDIRRGGRLLLFPEGTRTRRHPIGPLKASLSVIAQRAQAPVQTVLIDTDSLFLTKGWPLYKVPRFPITYRVRLGRRFPPSTDGQALMAELETYFSSELALPCAPLSMSPSAAAKGAPTSESR